MMLNLGENQLLPLDLLEDTDGKDPQNMFKIFDGLFVANKFGAQVDF